MGVLLKRVSFFDPVIASYNLGNQIITESVEEVISEIFKKDFLFKLDPMDIGFNTMKYVNRSDFIFVAGTNLLSSNILRNRQFDIGIVKSFFMKKMILLGVGWQDYSNVNLYSKLLLNFNLDGHYFHSVRDSYAKNKLNQLGIKNVLITGCPTLWNLNFTKLEKSFQRKNKNVVFTLTDYRPNKKRDLQIVNFVKNNYSKIYFWPQGVGDVDYLKKNFDISNFEILPARLNVFDKILEKNNIEYFGTRLHAGVRALQKNKKATIVGIDSRSIEMKKDFGLPVVEVKKNFLKDFNSISDFNLVMPSKNINLWKGQFK
jgi:polysaccharide pyruvyl transferase WcaK-like protein